MWAAESALLDQLPNGGAVVAVITITVLFIRKLEKTEGMITHLIETFAAESSASRGEYREHVSEIMRQGLTAHAETREAIRALNATLAAVRDHQEGGPP
jgi:ferritin-like metal-binding protein YciE